MIVILEKDADRGEIDAVSRRVMENGASGTCLAEGEEHLILTVCGDVSRLDAGVIGTMHGVERVITVTEPYRLASRKGKVGNTKVSVGGAVFGGKRIGVIAGPCAVESTGQIAEAAAAVKGAGAAVLRGGAFKPRTSPYSYQGMGEEGLRLLRAAGKASGLPVISEILSPEQLTLFEETVDVIQVGARNMQNYALLRALGRSEKPVLLKRGMMATVEEWLLSAEYILAGGNEQVILCERGIRTFEPGTRFTLDLSAVAQVKQLSHLPVVVDPSHAGGRASLVESLSLAAVAAGADGLELEVHPDPASALSDGAQALTPEEFRRLMERLRGLAPCVGREL